MSSVRVGLTLKGSEWLKEHLRRATSTKLTQRVAEGAVAIDDASKELPDVVDTGVVHVDD